MAADSTGNTIGIIAGGDVALVADPDGALPQGPVGRGDFLIIKNAPDGGWADLQDMIDSGNILVL